MRLIELRAIFLPSVTIQLGIQVAGICATSRGALKLIQTSRVILAICYIYSFESQSYLTRVVLLVGELSVILWKNRGARELTWTLQNQEWVLKEELIQAMHVYMN